MKHVYGPIPSRRLGRSLGVDPVPLKTCNWNCLYCQLGRTVPLTNARRAYVNRNELISEVYTVLADAGREEIDWVTFAGSGEPTLNIDLGWLIRKIKKIADVPVAVITNGALLFDVAVQNDLLAADAVLPTLDAGSAQLYRILNRPHPGVPFERYIAGLRTFRQRYQGRFWVEVMLVQGINDSEIALREIKSVLDQLAPDAIHLNLPIRPGAESWARPPNEEGLARAVAILGEDAEVVRPTEEDYDLGHETTPVEAILRIIGRHPISESELKGHFDRDPSIDVGTILDALETSGQAKVVNSFDGQRFWTLPTAVFPDDEDSRHAMPHSTILTELPS